jgi:outer membrane protein assembly factor BamB
MRSLIFRSPRTRIGVALVGLTALIVIGVKQPSGAADSAVEPETTKTSWTSFRGTADLRGVASVEALLEKPRLLWKTGLSDGVESTAAIVDGRVVVATLSGIVVALGLERGNEIWRKQVEDGGFTASPLVLGGVVYIGDDVGTFHTFRLSDGNPGWTYETGSEIRSSANVHGSHVLFAAYDHHLHCLNASTGAVSWKLPTEGPVHSTPAVADGKTFVIGCDNHFRVVDLARGQEIRAKNVGSYTAASPAVLGDRAFFGTSSGRVLALDWRKAAEVWSYESERGSEFRGSCAVVPGRLVITGRDRIVHCLNTESGKKLWTFATRRQMDSSPVIVDRRVFVGGNDGNLYMLDLDSTDPAGRELWKFTTGARILASPAIADGRLVIADDDGNVYCFALSASAARNMATEPGRPAAPAKIGVDGKSAEEKKS